MDVSKWMHNFWSLHQVRERIQPEDLFMSLWKQPHHIVIVIFMHKYI